MDHILRTVNGYDVYASSFMTGDKPAQSYGICGGREDFDTRHLRDLWDGCIDAVDWILGGGCRVHVGEGAIVPRLIGSRDTI